MKKRILFCIFPGLVAFLPAGQKDIHRTWPHPEFALSHNQFAFHLLNTVLDQDKSSGNKLISPLSLYFSLSMLYNGAGHATRDSIGETLHAGDLEIPNLNSACKEALQQMPLTDNTIQLAIANSIWYNRRKMTLSPTYESIAENFFYTQPQPLNFGNREATAHMNQWMEKNSLHMVPVIIDRSNPSDGMYLLNAFCFKGGWSQPFSAEQSYTGDFYVQPNTPPLKVRYMNKTAVFRTFSDTAFTMVELPVGDGKCYSLFTLLPEDGSLSMTDWVRTLTPERLNDALDKLTPQTIDLSVPSWECSYSVSDLPAILSRLGMGIAFSRKGEADFSNMYSSGGRRTFVSQVRQAACIRVSENGLSQGVSPAMAPASSMPAAPVVAHNRRQPRSIHYDHPFFYVLLEKQRNLVMMTGLVNDPSPIAAPAPPPPKPAATRRRWLKKK